MAKERKLTTKEKHVKAVVEQLLKELVDDIILHPETYIQGEPK